MKSVRRMACLAAFLLAAAGVVAVLASPVQANYITVYGGPTYDPATGAGFLGGFGQAVNDAGTAVGYAQKFVVAPGLDQGLRAVRWDASGTAATELGNLGTDVYGYTRCYAWAINSAGTAVGSAEWFYAGLIEGTHAVYWGLDGVPVDLNDLIDPSSGWILTEALAISDTGWVTGTGQFDPDGTGYLGTYQRGFLMQVPEPATLSLLVVGGLAVLRRRRW